MDSSAARHQSIELRLAPISLKEANAFVDAIHRHRGPVAGHKVSIAAADESGRVRAVAILGRPVARGRDDGRTLEVARLASDGVPNACSFLYAAAWRAAKALGYERVGTYTMAHESGASLRAAGWVPVGTVRGRSWDTPSRRRRDAGPLADKVLWQPGFTR